MQKTIYDLVQEYSDERRGIVAHPLVGAIAKAMGARVTPLSDLAGYHGGRHRAGAAAAAASPGDDSISTDSATHVQDINGRLTLIEDDGDDIKAYSGVNSAGERYIAVSARALGANEEILKRQLWLYLREVVRRAWAADVGTNYSEQKAGRENSQLLMVYPKAAAAHLDVFPKY